MSNFSDDFLRGMQDCQSGRPATVGASDEYNRGYGTQYESEALISEMSLNQEQVWMAL